MIPTHILRSGSAILLAGALLSCDRQQEAGAAAPPVGPMPVQVSRPVPTEVTEYNEYTGRLAAVESVELRARVSGYLDEILFEAGAEVRKGDPLFIIDQRPYRNALLSAEAEVERVKASVVLAESEAERARKLSGDSAISTSEVERRMAEASQARASLKAAEAAVEMALLDLAFTEIKAPIDGRISRELVTVGNLIQGGTSSGQVLATIVTVDPIHVYIDADERSVIDYRRAIERGEREDIVDGNTIPFELGLIGQEEFPYTGQFDYVDNQLDPSTGTLRVRGVLENTEGLLSPGMFARIRVTSGDVYPAFLLHERAILTDQGNPFVYVVSAENTVEFRPIETGPVREGLRVVRKGVGPQDRVIVAGVMRLRPGAPVDPQEGPMPGTAAAESAPPASPEESPVAAAADENG